MLKRNKGITLIALVITIIILLILAGVTLSLIAGENGILKRATKAVDINEAGTAKEQVSLEIANYQTQYYEKKYIDGEIDAEIKVGDWIYNICKDKEIKTDDYVFIIKAPSEGEPDENNPYIVTIKKNNKLKSTVTGTLSIDGKLKWEDVVNGESDAKIQITTPIIGITIDATTSVEDNSQTKGNTLYINFSATLEGENCTIQNKADNQSVPYAITQNGTYTFIVTGEYGGKIISKEVDIVVIKYNVLGAFVEYDAGDWTKEEIEELKSLKLYDINTSHTKNNICKLLNDKGLNLTFGGFTYKGDTENSSFIESGAVITSRNQSVSPENGQGTPEYDGWKIYECEKKELNGETRLYVKNLIHAGSSENFVYYRTSADTSDTYGDGRASYILSSGTKRTNYSKLSNGTPLNPRNWDMYKDQEQLELINKVCLVGTFTLRKDIAKTSGSYWTDSASYGLFFYGPNGYIAVNGPSQSENGCYGVRPFVELNEGVYIKSGDGTEASPFVLAKD